MDAEQTEDSFPLLPFSPQCGHLYRVWLIIPYPQTWQADAMTLSLCVCVSIALVCLCALLLLCVLILSPRICLYAHACYMLTTMFVVCSSAFGCQCVGACEGGGSHRQLVSVCVCVWHLWHILFVYRCAATSYDQSPWQPSILGVN